MIYDIQINIKIAESLGFKVFKAGDVWFTTDAPIPDDSDSGSLKVNILPDYCSNLEAIRDVVKTLKEAEKLLYVISLLDLEGGGNNSCELFSQELLLVSEATAKNRAIAYLVVKGIIFYCKEAADRNSILIQFNEQATTHPC